MKSKYKSKFGFIYVCILNKVIFQDAPARISICLLSVYFVYELLDTFNDSSVYSNNVIKKFKFIIV